MATVTEMRRVLRDAGEDVPERGRLNADLQARYAELASAADDGWDLPGGPDPSVPLQPERPPRTQRQARRERRARPIGERLLGKRGDSKAREPKRKHKRIPVDHLVARVWEGVARFALPLSLPLSRCLQVQSPVAGLILEDIVAGTIVDRALQPVARAEEKAEKVLALIAPPVLVVAIEQSMTLPPEAMMMRQAILMPMLKESLRIWLTVAGPKVEEAAQREAEYQEKFGRSIDEMIALFFGPAVTVEAEPDMAGAAA